MKEKGGRLDAAAGGNDDDAVSGPSTETEEFTPPSIITRF